MHTTLLSADSTGIAHAIALLRAGELVAFGTETVYGLGADASNERAVAAVFEAKARPRFNPLIAHYADAAMALAHVEANETARRLAQRYWPGPLTLVLPRTRDCPVALLASAGGDTLAIRVPAHTTAHILLTGFGGPIVAPSANRSGRVSPTTAAHVMAELDGRIAAVLDSGPCDVGVESTVLDLTGAAPILLRAGGIALEDLEADVGPVALGAPVEGRLRSPGMLESHYAPELPVRLDATTVSADEALLAFGRPLAGSALTFDLSERGDLVEAAARLFAGLRWLDEEGRRHGLTRIAVMPVPDERLGRAINDRLRRAAAR